MKLLRNAVIRAGLEALYFSGAHYLLRPIFAGVGGKGDVAAGDLDPGLVEHGILQRGGGAGGQVGFKGSGTRPGRDCPKDDQWNSARPPLAAPLEKSVHSMSRASGNREKTNPCGAVKPEITGSGPAHGRRSD